MSEISAYDDMDQFGGETADALDELGQDLYHRLIEDKGSNLEDPERGLGIEDMLGGTFDPALGSKIEAELRKDPRVSAVLSKVTIRDNGEFRIEVQIEANEQELGITLESDGLGGIRRVAA